jgi:glutathione S-transferase
MVGWGSLDSVVERLDALATAASPYILGEKFTALDVYLGAQIGFGLQFGSMPKLASFEAYVGRVMSRPAAMRAKEIDDALMTT